MKRRRNGRSASRQGRAAATVAFLAGAAPLALCAPRALAAEPEAPPADAASGRSDEPRMVRYPPSSARGWVLGSGVGLTATAYGIGMACGFGWNDVPGADALKVPVVGPWVALGQSGCAPDQDECTAMLVLRTILTTLDGLAQLGGVALVLEGIIMTTEADAPADDKAPAGAPTAAGSGPTAALVPVIAPHRGGLLFDVRF